MYECSKNESNYFNTYFNRDSLRKPKCEFNSDVIDILELEKDKKEFIVNYKELVDALFNEIEIVLNGKIDFIHIYRVSELMNFLLISFRSYFLKKIFEHDFNSIFTNLSSPFTTIEYLFYI
jgi:hypothetical protein